jgi:uncharacterized membrane protein
MLDRLLLLVLSVGTLSFLFVIGYSVRVIFADFGPVIGVLASASVAFGFVSLGFLLDSRQR